MHNESSHGKRPTVTPSSKCFGPDCAMIALFVGGFVLLALLIAALPGVQLINPNSLLGH